MRAITPGTRMVNANGMAGEGRRTNVTITCPHCRRIGFVVWEDAGENDGERGSERHLIHVSRGFHPELRRSRPDPLIVCDACDTMQTA